MGRAIVARDRGAGFRQRRVPPQTQRLAKDTALALSIALCAGTPAPGERQPGRTWDPGGAAALAVLAPRASGPIHGSRGRPTGCVLPSPEPLTAQDTILSVGNYNGGDVDIIADLKRRHGFRYVSM